MLNWSVAVVFTCNWNVTVILYWNVFVVFHWNVTVY